MFKITNTVKLPIKIFLNYAYDLKRFLKWSSIGQNIDTPTKLRALITMDYHRIEKGLSLKYPKVGFGKDVINRLVVYLPQYQQKYGSDETMLIALNALQAYYEFNLENGCDDETLYNHLITIRSKIPKDKSNVNQGGIVNITKQKILDSALIDLSQFFSSRYSIRQFSSQEVDMSLVEKAVIMAQKTPSVCNRQSCRVYVFSDEDKKAKLLSYQNGNRGFGEQISKLLIVVSNLEHFTSLGERNQAWIDGGMFSMSLIYALHSLGLGTCCLNWSVEYKRDKLLKSVAGISESDSVIMMIAVGHLPEKLNVAQSPRKNLDEVLLIK